jgi:hypothetical protein
MKDEIKKLLVESAVPVQISFTKKDGTIRHMICTSNFNLIPEHDHPANDNTERVLNDEICCVYDLENNGWRSFILANIISFKPTV